MVLWSCKSKIVIEQPEVKLDICEAVLLLKILVIKSSVIIPKVLLEFTIPPYIFLASQALS